MATSGHIREESRLKDPAAKDPAARKPRTGGLFEQKHRANVKCADFDAIVSIDDQNHLDSITQEQRTA